MVVYGLKLRCVQGKRLEGGGNQPGGEKIWISTTVHCDPALVLSPSTQTFPPRAPCALAVLSPGL